MEAGQRQRQTDSVDMDKKQTEKNELGNQFLRDQKRILALLRGEATHSHFEHAIHRLVGKNEKRGKTIKIGNVEIQYSNFKKNQFSFLPTLWLEELDRTKGIWSGCENWWAGYPFIVWVEERVDEGTTGYLNLNAEVGPISDHKIRRGIIGAIKAAASTKGFERVQFPAGSTEKGRLYSRFLSRNAIAVDDLRDTDEMELKLVELVVNFKPEFELVANVLSQL